MKIIINRKPVSSAIVILLGVMFIFCSCAKEEVSDQLLDTRQNSNHKNTKLEKSDDNKIKLDSLSPEQITKLKSGLIKIKVGDSYEKVISILGEPTLFRKSFSKIGGELLGYSAIYEIKRESYPIPNMNDSIVFIRFDVEKKLEKIHKQNVDF
ncbi:MAG: hypothetical protein JEZ07_18755 [Phycisphaerae bacterium]|nr:hypothetical protein [Phycisphaerae bacterium]